MATSGTFTGARGGGAYGPWLTLDWDRIQTDIPNNRSLIRLTLKLNASNPTYFSSSKTGVLEATSFTYSGGFSGTGAVVIKNQDVWVNHNADGTKSETFSASFNIAITFSGSYISSLSVSGTAAIDTIPRASGFTAFTLTNTVLNTGVATTINYTLARQSTSFTQDMTLKYGSKVIASWNTAGTGALTRALSATEVNAIIVAMSTVVSGNLSLYMQTKSGSTLIGSSIAILEGITLNAAIKPTASALTANIWGGGRDATIGKFVQAISKVVGKFTSTSGYGSTISANTITVKRQSDGGNSQTIFSNDGTTANPVTLSGVYIVTGEVKDSRGRTATVSVTITVEAYTPPTISLFTTNRTSANSATVSAPINTSWSALGTSNPATVQVKSVDKAGAVVILYTLSSSTLGVLNTTQSYPNQSDAGSYTYTLTVTDSFGKVATAIATVGTSFVELTIAKGLGVGIGKVHEQGALDVKGEAFLTGKVEISSGGQAINIKAGPASDHVYIALYADSQAQTVRSGYLGYPSAGETNLYMVNSMPNGNIVLIPNGSGYVKADGNLEVIGGVNAVGDVSGNKLYGALNHTAGYLNVGSFSTTDANYGVGNARVFYSPVNKTMTFWNHLGALITLKAAAFSTTSERRLKTNIVKYQTSALEKVVNTAVYEYNLKSEIEIWDEVSDGVWEDTGRRRSPEGLKKRHGLIVDEAPTEIVSEKQDGIDLYEMNSMLWKAVQELSSKVDVLTQQIIDIKAGM